jgi:hypothetical protein
MKYLNGWMRVCWQAKILFPNLFWYRNFYVNHCYWNILHSLKISDSSNRVPYFFLIVSYLAPFSEENGAFVMTLFALVNLLISAIHSETTEAFHFKFSIHVDVINERNCKRAHNPKISFCSLFNLHFLPL